MQTVSPSFHQKSQAGIRKHRWSLLASFDKRFDDSRTFFTLDSSLLDGPDLITPLGDNPIQYWDYYNYDSYTDRVMSMEWGSQTDFPYSVYSSSASVLLRNTDNYFSSIKGISPQYQIVNHSINPSFESGSGNMVEVRRNYAPNPRMKGTPTDGIAPFYRVYNGNSTPTGTRSVVGTTEKRQRIHVTAYSGGNRRYGVALNGSSQVWNSVTLGAGRVVQFSVKAWFDAGFPAGVTPQIHIEYYNGVTFVGQSTFNLDKTKSGQRQYNTLTTTATANRFYTYVWMYGSADGAVSNAGLEFRECMFEVIGGSHGYFDGSTNEFYPNDLVPSWTGTPDASESILSGEFPSHAVNYNVDTVNGAKMWMSTDNPNNGTRFVRSLAVKSGDFQISPMDTMDIVSGVSRTGMLSVRSSRNLTGQPRWRESTGLGANTVAGGTESVTNTWKEIVRTGTPTYNDAVLQILFSSGVVSGDLIDFDNHYAITGTYTGGYFDGNTSDAGDSTYEWSGPPNSSTSVRSVYSGNISPVHKYMIPGRPIKILSGYENEPLLQQFTGITQDKPEIDRSAGTAKFIALDYLSEIFKLQLSESFAMSDAWTGEIIEALLNQFGVENFQYSLDRGRNKVPFVFFEKGTTASECLRKVLEAEGGKLWIDSQGIIRFSPRLALPSSPVMTFNESNISSITTTEDTEIINRIIIRSNIRKVQEPQPIHTGSGEIDDPELSSSLQIPAYGQYTYRFELKNPIEGYSEPTIGRLPNDSWFTAKTPGGSDVVGGVLVADSDLSMTEVRLVFENTNGFPVSINAMVVYGEPAKIVDTIEYEAYDQDSIDKYGEFLLEIENDMFGSESNCESFAYTIIDSFSEFDGIVEMSVKGDAALELGDIIGVDTRKVTGQFQIIKIDNSISDSGVTQIIKAKRYTPRYWFILDESLLDDDSNVLAP